MSFLSLEKYLYGAAKPGASVSAAPADTALCQFAQGILGSFGRSVLSGEAFEDLAKELDTLRTGLSTNLPPELLVQIAGRFEDLASSFRERLTKIDQERSEDFRKALTILNEALTHLAAGSERSEICFKKLEESLQTAARVNDLRTLKLQLADVLKFVRQQSELESQQSQGALQNLTEQVRQANDNVSRFGASLPGRDQAIAALSESIRIPSAGKESLYAALFVADALGALRTRHGSQVCDGLLEELSRRDILGILPGGRIFRWSANAVLAVWNSEEELAWVSNHIANACKAPFDHRAFVGARVASFSIPVRSVTMIARGDLREIVPDLDRFEAGR